MKIISKGKVYRATCDMCGCVFEYTQRDVDYDATVKCPMCRNIIAHAKDNEVD